MNILRRFAKFLLGFLIYIATIALIYGTYTYIFLLDPNSYTEPIEQSGVADEIPEIISEQASAALIENVEQEIQDELGGSIEVSSQIQEKLEEIIETSFEGLISSEIVIVTVENNIVNFTDFAKSEIRNPVVFIPKQYVFDSISERLTIITDRIQDEISQIRTCEDGELITISDTIEITPDRAIRINCIPPLAKAILQNDEQFRVLDSPEIIIDEIIGSNPIFAGEDEVELAELFDLLEKNGQQIENREEIFGALYDFQDGVRTIRNVLILAWIVLGLMLLAFFALTHGNLLEKSKSTSKLLLSVATSLLISTALTKFLVVGSLESESFKNIIRQANSADTAISESTIDSIIEFIQTFIDVYISPLFIISLIFFILVFVSFFTMWYLQRRENRVFEDNHERDAS